MPTHTKTANQLVDAILKLSYGARLDVTAARGCWHAGIKGCSRIIRRVGIRGLEVRSPFCRNGFRIQLIILKKAIDVSPAIDIHPVCSQFIWWAVLFGIKKLNPLKFENPMSIRCVLRQCDVLFREASEFAAADGTARIPFACIL
jgi:hypothetical protein